MHVHFLDPYRPRQSLIHRLDARIKLVLALAFILTVGLTPPGAWAAYVLILAVVLSIVILSGLGVGYVLKRASLALPFILAALPIQFTTPGEPLLCFSVGPWVLTVTLPGLERFLSIAVKSWISVQIAIVLAASTAFPDLLMAMRAVHFPRLLVSTFSLVLHHDSRIEVVIKAPSEDVYITMDGQVGFPLLMEDVIELGSGPCKTRLLVPADRDYFRLLRTKLKWGER